MANIKTIYNYI